MKTHARNQSAQRLAMAMAATICLLATSWTYANKGQTVTLRWKLKPGETLGYHSTMGERKGPDRMAIPLRKMAFGAKLSIKEKRAFKLLKSSTSYEFASLLQRKGKNKISVKMISTGVLPPGLSKQAKRMHRMMASRGRVQLRGHISNTGKLQSFYLQNRQKNIINLMYHLPQKPIRVGDRWPIPINFLAMGAGILPIRAGQSCYATLVSLHKTKTDTIATIYYHIAQSFIGQMPHGPKQMSMEMGFVGHGEFLLKAGRWKRFYGRMHFQSTGHMNRSQQTHFELQPMRKIPPQFLKAK